LMIRADESQFDLTGDFTSKDISEYSKYPSGLAMRTLNPNSPADTLLMNVGANTHATRCSRGGGTAASSPSPGPLRVQPSLVHMLVPGGLCPPPTSGLVGPVGPWALLPVGPGALNP
jgi:hypothetical protein